MLEKIDFFYDGIPSSQMGLINVNRSGDLFNEPLIASRRIIEQTVPGNDKPYFMGVERDPLSFNLSFFVDQQWIKNSPYDDIDLNAIARWLAADNYKPLYFSDNPDKIYYCMPINDVSWIHNGLKQGFVQLTMRCSDSWVYSPTYLSSVFDFTNNTENGTELVISNDGDTIIYPEIEIKKIGDGDISIINNSNGGLDFTFTGLVDGETVYVDNENEDIVSSLPLVYRFSNFNDHYMSFVRGDNHLLIKGRCQLQFRYAFKYYQ